MVACFLTALAGCATTQSDWQKTVAKTQTENLDFPVLSAEMSRALGDTLVQKGFKSSVVAIEFLSDWKMKEETSVAPAYFVPEGKEGELWGIWSNSKTGERMECYALEYGYPAHWNYQYYGTGYDIPFYLCERSDGSFAPLQKLDASLRQASQPFTTIPSDSLLLRKYKKVSLTSPSYVQQIIYNGRVGDSLKFIYREFAGDYIRPAPPPP